jgi:hypothetical protein
MPDRREFLGAVATLSWWLQSAPVVNPPVVSEGQMIAESLPAIMGFKGGPYMGPEIEWVRWPHTLEVLPCLTDERS